MEQIVGSLELQGNAYLFKDYLGTDLPRQFWVLNPTSVSPIPGPNRTTAGYEARDGNRTIIIPRQQVVHFRLYDPDHGIVGASPMQALRLSYETHRDMSRFMRLFYEKGGSVAGHYSTENPLEREDIERLKKDLQKKFGGPENAWDPILLPSGLKYVRAGLTMKEMEFIQNHELTLKDILMTYKVPSAYANIIEGTGLNSDVMKVVRLMLHENAVEPLCTRIAATINELMLNTGEFGNGVFCKFDFSGVLAIQEVFLDQAKAYLAATGGPVMSRAEGRKRLNLPELDDPELDVILVPGTMSDTVEKPEPAPAPATQAKTRGREPTRDFLRRRADRLLKRHERLVRSAFVRVFNAQQGRVRAQLKKDAVGTVMSRAIDPQDLLADDAADVRLVKRFIRAVVRDRGDEAMAEVSAELAYDVNARSAASFIDTKAFESVTRTSATTRKELAESVAEGMREQESLGELLGRVDDVFNGRRANALTIARTETAGAYNFASQDAWEQSGVVEAKEWLTAHDELVRDSHAEAEAQGPIPIGERFEVGEDMLMFPGDPDGSPGEVINCRCTIVPVVNASLAASGPLPDSIRQRIGATSRNGKVGTNGSGPKSLEELFK